MTKGGKREGSGRKPRTSEPTIVRGIRFTQSEWNEIIVGATFRGMKPSEYVRTKTLE